MNISSKYLTTHLSIKVLRRTIMSELNNAVITRQSQIEKLGLVNLPEMAKDLVLNQPTNVKERVESRMTHVRNCLEAVQSKLGREDRAYSILVLVAELIGTGGHNDLGTQWGGETTRLPFFATCGTGRRHAGDGGAWNQAIRDVLHDEISSYPDETGSTNGQLTIHWDSQFREVELMVRYSTTGEIAAVEQLYSQDESWEVDVTGPLMALGLARSMRALLGQTLVAVTRDQAYLALTHNDVTDGVTWNGIAIDVDSFKTPGALEAVGLGFEFWSNKL